MCSSLHCQGTSSCNSCINGTGPGNFGTSGHCMFVRNLIGPWLPQNLFSFLSDSVLYKVRATTRPLNAFIFCEMLQLHCYKNATQCHFNSLRSKESGQLELKIRRESDTKHIFGTCWNSFKSLVQPIIIIIIMNSLSALQQLSTDHDTTSIQVMAMKCLSALYPLFQSCCCTQSSGCTTMAAEY